MSDLSKIFALPDTLLKSKKYCTYLRGPESTSIELPPFESHFINFLKTVFYYLNLVLKGGISIDADFGSLGYVL